MQNLAHIKARQRWRHQRRARKNLKIIFTLKISSLISAFSTRIYGWIVNFIRNKYFVYHLALFRYTFSLRITFYNHFECEIIYEPLRTSSSKNLFASTMTSIEWKLFLVLDRSEINDTNTRENITLATQADDQRSWERAVRFHNKSSTTAKHFVWDCWELLFSFHVHDVDRRFAFT